MLKFAWWGNPVAFAVLTLFLAGPLEGKVAPDTGPAGVSDYGQFLGEYLAAGAFKFYDNTEALLRLAQFELSLMRYRFLKGQIQRKGDYRGLLAMVDHRLKFLKKQLHLGEMDIAAIPPRKERIPRAKPPEPKPNPEKPAAAKPKTPKDANQEDDLAKDTAKKETASGNPLSPGVAVTAPPATTGKPPEVVVADTSKSKEEKAEEEKAKEEAKPPPPPPGFWEKLKIRLRLKKKAAESG
jgi:hypothetical protein